MATHSSILAWEIPWTEELGGHGVARIGHNLVTKAPLFLDNCSQCDAKDQCMKGTVNLSDGKTSLKNRATVEVRNFRYYFHKVLQKDQS